MDESEWDSREDALGKLLAAATKSRDLRRSRAARPVSPIPGTSDSMSGARISGSMRRMQRVQREEKEEVKQTGSRSRSQPRIANNRLNRNAATRSRSQPPMEETHTRRISRGKSRSPFRDPERLHDSRHENAGNISVQKIFTYRVSENVNKSLQAQGKH